MSTKDEALLMRAIAARRNAVDAAFEQFDRIFRPVIWKQVRAMISARDAADVDDVTQKVMMLVLRSAHQFDPARASLKTWVHQITTNAAIHHIQKKRRQESVDAQALPVSTERSDRRAEMCQRLPSALNSLTRFERAMVVLKLLELSNAEIALALDIDEESVPTLLSRAKRKVTEANRSSQRRPEGEGHHA